ncbi:MAG: phospholipase D-like domain-containing protein, partial [Pseudomonadota bacterium]
MDEALSSLAHGNVKAAQAQVILDNKLAFESKLHLIKQAKKELRLSYYIFSDDQSAAVLVDELFKAARRGVDIKILTDLNMEYANLDYFSMLMEKGQGKIEIRFYGRPARTVMKDAVYMTSNCLDGEVPDASKNRCYQRKIEQVDKLFSAHDSDQDIKLNISTVDSGLSGLLFSGIYGKDFELIASAVMQGEKNDLAQFKNGKGISAEDKSSLLRLAKIYWRSKHGDNVFIRLINKLQLAAAWFVYHDQINAILTPLREYLPIKVGDRHQSQKDWSHLTDFT